ncbi:putative ribonuclease H-like domain-containing protein [Tanacetum coccineum]
MKPTEVNESGASDKGEEDEQDTRIAFLDQLLLRRSFITSLHACEASNAFEDVGAEADLNNMETPRSQSYFHNSELTRDHPIDQIIIDLNSAIQTENETRFLMTAMVYWVEAMQEELLQFKLQKVWTLVDLPNGKRAIGTKWVFRNKKDERGIVVRNKARLVAQGYTQEEGI